MFDWLFESGISIEMVYYTTFDSFGLVVWFSQISQLWSTRNFGPAPAKDLFIAKMVFDLLGKRSGLAALQSATRGSVGHSSRLVRICPAGHFKA